MKHLTYLTILLTILITGCSKDDDPGVIFSGKRLSQVIENGDFTTRYVYDRNGRVDSVISKFDQVNFELHRAYHYDDQNRMISIESYRPDFDGNLALSGTTINTYENGLLKSATLDNRETVYNYSNGVCTELVRYTDDVLDSRSTFTYTGQNITGTRIINYDDLGEFLWEIDVDNTLDSQQDPYRYFYQFLPGFPRSANNITERLQTIVETLNPTLSLGQSRYEYTYDADGYPTIRTSFYLDEEFDIWIENNTIEYVYE